MMNSTQPRANIAEPEHAQKIRASIWRRYGKALLARFHQRSGTRQDGRLRRGEKKGGKLLRLLVGFLTGAVLGGLTVPAARLLATVLGLNASDTWLEVFVTYGSYSAFGFFAGLLAGRIAGRYEVLIAVVSVLVGLTCALAVDIYLLPPEAGHELIPLPFVLLLVGWAPMFPAIIGGFIALLRRRRTAQTSEREERGPSSAS